jgi:uncharacterized membrane protein
MSPISIERRLLWAYPGYVALSIIVYILSGRFEHFFFAINLTLAFVPLVLARRFDKEIKKPWAWWALFACVVAFFPNAFYLFTDFIHLGGTSFFGREHPYAPLVYERNWIDWLRVVHIAMGAVLGGLAGVAAYARLKEAVIKNIPRVKHWLPLVLLLSAVGIYIGRFLRFNSWDLVFRPFLVLRSILGELDGFALAFVLMFFGLQWGLIALLGPLSERSTKEEVRDQAL